MQIANIKINRKLINSTLLIFATFYCLYTRAQSTAQLLVQDGHDAPVTSSIISHDGKYFLTADERQNIILWSVDNGKKVGMLSGKMDEWNKNLKNKIEQIFCSQGKQLVISENSVDGYKRIELQLLSKALPVKSVEKIIAPDEVHSIFINKTSIMHTYLKYFNAYLKISNDGKYAITTDIDGSPCIYDIAAAHIVKKYTDLKEGFVCADISKDNRLVLLVSKEKKLIVCDSKTGNINATLMTKTPLTVAQFSLDGKKILMCGAGKTYDIVNISTGQTEIQLQAYDPGTPAECIDQFTNQNTGTSFIAIGNSYGNATIYNSQTGNVISKLTSIDRDLITSCKFSPNGKYIVTTSGNRAKVWWVSEALLLEDFTGNVQEPLIGKYNHDGLLEITTQNGLTFFDISVAEMKYGTSKIIDINNHNKGLDEDNLPQTKANKVVKTDKPSLATNGKIIITKRKRFDEDKPDDTEEIEKLREQITGKRKYTSGDFSIKRSKGELEIVNDRKHKTLTTLKIDAFEPYFFPNGKYVAIFEKSDQPTSKIRIISLADGRIVKELSGYEPDGFKESEFISPDGKYIIVPSTNKTAKGMEDITTLIAYETNSWNRVSTINTGFGGLIKFKPQTAGDETTVFLSSLSLDGDSKSQIWKLNKEAAIANNEKSFSSTKATFSTEGKYLFTQYGKAIQIRNSGGELLASLYLLGNNDYFITTPDGYYKCTHNAPKYISYLTKEFIVTDFQQFDLKYNRPDIVLERLGSTNIALVSTYRKVYNKRLENANISPGTLNSTYPFPEIKIANTNDIERLQKKSQVKIRLKADSKNFLASANIYINGVPIYGRAGISVFNKTRSLDTTISITLSRGENVITATATDKNNASSYGSAIKVYYKSIVPSRPKLYFIGIGANMYQDKRKNLKWCANDVTSLSEKLSDLGSARRNEVITKVLINKEVTTANILSCRKALEALTEDDKVVILYSGHGLLSKNEQLYLGTYPIDFSNPAKDGVQYQSLENMLDGIKPRKKLLLVDACNSGRIDQSGGLYATNSGVTAGKKGADVSGNGQLSSQQQSIFDLMQEMFIHSDKDNGTTVISAARGSQNALEKDDIENGVFTSSIIGYLSRYTECSVTDLANQIVKGVSEKTGGQQVPTVRMENKTVDWKLFELE